MSEEYDSFGSEMPVNEYASATVIIDDGCDWAAWLVWSMNSRRRLSEKLFALPPARPQVMKVSIKPKKKRPRRKIRPLSELLA